MRKPPDKTAGRWREVLFHMRLPLCTLLALSVLAAFGIVLLRSTLLKNAYNTGYGPFPELCRRGEQQPGCLSDAAHLWHGFHRLARGAGRRARRSCGSG